MLELPIIAEKKSTTGAGNKSLQLRRVYSHGLRFVSTSPTSFFTIDGSIRKPGPVFRVEIIEHPARNFDCRGVISELRSP